MPIGNTSWRRSAWTSKPYQPVLFAVVGFITFAFLALAHRLHPSVNTAVGDRTCAWSMPVIGDARRRFNFRFYLIALLFLLVHVEGVFLWPWALAYCHAATGCNAAWRASSTTRCFPHLVEGDQNTDMVAILGLLNIIAADLARREVNTRGSFEQNRPAGIQVHQGLDP